VREEEREGGRRGRREERPTHKDSEELREHRADEEERQWRQVQSPVDDARCSGEGDKGDEELEEEERALFEKAGGSSDEDRCKRRGRGRTMGKGAKTVMRR